jgi:hypothetical protein
LRSSALRLSHDCTDLGSGVWKDVNPPFNAAGGKSFEKPDEIDANTIGTTAKFIILLPAKFLREAIMVVRVRHMTNAVIALLKVFPLCVAD